MTHHDVVIVGAGAGGAATAWRLCSHGLRVLLLDAGPRFDPARDYTLHKPDWERWPFPEKPGSQGNFSIGRLDRLDPMHQSLRSWNKATGPTVRETTRQALGPGYWHVQGIGGTTLHFVGEAHRLHPSAMRMRSTFGVAADWPLSYADLEPYYSLCEYRVGVAGPAEQKGRWRSMPYPLPAHPLSPGARHLATAAQRLGMSWEPNSRAALSQAYDGRPACNYCGNCNRGCPIGDKGSADVTYIRWAEATGRLSIKPLSPVIKLHAGKSGRIDAIDYLEGKHLRRVATPLLVIAAGAVQTPRLLLANASRAHPNGLANSSRQVGKNLMESLIWNSSGRVPGLSNTHVGLPSDAICWDFNAPDSLPGIAGGVRFNSSNQEIGFTGPIAYATRAVPGFGHDLKRSLREQFGSIISVGGIGEFLPNDDSYVDLDPGKKDRTGMPYARLNVHLGDSEIQRLHFMATTARRLLAEAGAELVEEFGAWDQLAATHIFGTCRMGHSAANSVVDANCRSHDIENLYITDASVFPSSGGGESPSLTIQALAVRAADQMLR